MSLETKMDIWVEVIKTRIPDITYPEAAMISLKAASDWYMGSDPELSKLFEQYLMFKTLKGLNDDEQTKKTI